MKALYLIPMIVATATAMEIDFKKKFELEIMPNTLQAYINITVKKQSEQDIISKLSHYSSYFNASNEVEKKGGNYNIHSEYVYENNKRYKNGFIGTISYEIKAKRSEIINKFITTLYNQKSDNSVDISTNSVTWIMGKEQGDGKVDELRFKAIDWAESYAKSLSNKLSKLCKVANISFDNIQQNYPKPQINDHRLIELKSVGSSTPTPTQDSQKMSIKPTFKFFCK